jgi:hypothetical protein
MGYSLWIYPKSVLNGFKKGLNEIGIIDLKISRSNFMKMEYSELIRITKKEKTTEINVIQWTKFLLWIITSQIIFLFPLIAIGIGLTIIMK